MSFPLQAEQRQSGFSAAEVLVASFIITVALVALAGVFPVSNQSISSANQRTTAALLAEQRMEQAKNDAVTNWTLLPVGPQPPEIMSGYTRTTQVTLVGGNPNLKQVTVTVALPNGVNVQLTSVVGN
jgi:hypothetical protein